MKIKAKTTPSGQAEGDGFARFGDLTRQMMSAPKKEIEEKATEQVKRSRQICLRGKIKAAVKHHLGYE
jgi:hypothetical protein